MHGNICIDLIRMNMYVEFFMQTILYQFKGNMSMKVTEMLQYIQRTWGQTVATLHTRLTPGGTCYVGLTGGVPLPGVTF